MCGEWGKCDRGVVSEPPFCSANLLQLLASASLGWFLVTTAGPHAGYGHFAEVYGQLQPYKSERHLGACLWTLLRHCAHPRSVPGGRCRRREASRLASTGLWLGHFQEDLLPDLSLPPPPQKNLPFQQACLKDSLRKTFSVQGVGGPRLGSWAGEDNLRIPGRGVSR